MIKRKEIKNKEVKRNNNIVLLVDGFFDIFFEQKLGNFSEIFRTSHEERGLSTLK